MKLRYYGNKDQSSDRHIAVHCQTTDLSGGNRPHRGTRVTRIDLCVYKPISGHTKRSHTYHRKNHPHKICQIRPTACRYKRRQNSERKCKNRVLKLDRFQKYTTSPPKECATSQYIVGHRKTFESTDRTEASNKDFKSDMTSFGDEPSANNQCTTTSFIAPSHTRDAKSVFSSRI